MHLEIRSRLEPLDEIRACVERRVAFALGRFGSRIRHVTVWLSDVNGPRGGPDKSCQVSVTLVPGGQVTVAAGRAESLEAIGRAVERAGRAVARELARRRERRTRPASTAAAAATGRGERRSCT
jgi:putative sigma-54 modulation protein